jgi:hypothetical protein
MYNVLNILDLVRKKVERPLFEPDLQRVTMDHEYTVIS